MQCNTIDLPEFKEKIYGGRKFDYLLTNLLLVLENWKTLLRTAYLFQDVEFLFLFEIHIQCNKKREFWKIFP